jgi:hypothetical protein
MFKFVVLSHATDEDAQSVAELSYGRVTISFNDLDNPNDAPGALDMECVFESLDDATRVAIAFEVDPDDIEIV